MLFKSGNPNLHDTTRRLAGDPHREDTGGSLYADQEVDDEINLALDELWRRAKSQDLGWGRVFGYATSVAEQVWYNLPGTLDTNLVAVEVEPAGRNINTDSAAEPVALKRGQHESEWLSWVKGDITVPEFWILGDSGSAAQYGIIAPPAVGGTSAIRLTYETEFSYLAGESDEPRIVPRSHRRLICLMAALSLRIGVDMETTEVLREMARLYPEFVEDMGPRFGEDLDGQPQTAGRTHQPFMTIQGFARRI